METEEKIPEIKIKNREESKKGQNRYNISNSNEMKEEDKDSSKISGEDNKGTINLNLSIQEKKSNSKIIQENSEEFENNVQNISNNSKLNEFSENKNNNEQSEKSEINDKKENMNNSEENLENKNEEEENSSFLDNKHYNNIKNDENDEINNLSGSGEEKKFKDKEYLNRKSPFMTTGKFMQIQPHFNIFSKRINTLRDNIYDNTKKCLIYKSSLQHSENLMRERANIIVKDLVEKIFNLRQIFLKSDKEIKSIINETNNNVLNLQNEQDNIKNDINDCEIRLNKCEGQIGYKLLGKPNYSFMKRTCINFENKMIKINDGNA